MGGPGDKDHPHPNPPHPHPNNPSTGSTPAPKPTTTPAPHVQPDVYKHPIELELKSDSSNNFHLEPLKRPGIPGFPSSWGSGDKVCLALTPEKEPAIKYEHGKPVDPEKIYVRARNFLLSLCDLWPTISLNRSAFS
jgi:hypothetical protein